MNRRAVALTSLTAIKTKHALSAQADDIVVISFDFGYTSVSDNISYRKYLEYKKAMLDGNHWSHVILFDDGGEWVVNGSQCYGLYLSNYEAEKLDTT